MTDVPPELPPGDDPWTLLGVEPGADRRTLKRAYTRLIRTYKPEKFPEEFQRIRAAYEALRDGAEHRSLSPDAFPSSPVEDSRADAPDPPPPPLDEGSAPPPPVEWEFDQAAPGEWQRAPAAPPEVDDPWSAPGVWNAAADGDLDTARRLLAERAVEREPHVADFAHAFLLDEVAGELDSADARLDAALAARVPIATWARSTLDPDTLNRITVRPAFSWTALREQPDRNAAAALYHYRSDELLMRGRIDRVVEEVSERDFRREALDDSVLRHVPVSVASALIWDDLERGLELFDTFAAEVSRDDEGGFEDVFLHVRRAAEAWHAWKGRSNAPAAYRRFLQLRVVVDPGQRRRLAKALHGDFRDRPNEYADFLLALSSTDEALISFHQYALWEADAFADDDTLTLVPPDAATIAAMTLAGTTIERDLERAGTNRVSSFVLLGHIALIVLGFVFLGWWGLLTMVVLAISGMKATSWFDLRLYRNRIRPTLVRLIAEHELHAAQIIEHIAGTKGLLDELARFKSEIAEDASLHHVFLLSRLRRYI